VFAAEKALAISRPVTRSASLVDGWWDGARARGAARVGGDTPYAAVCMSVWGLVTLVHQQPLFCLFFLSWADGFEPLRKVRTCLQRLMASASNQSIFLFFLKNPRFFLYRYLHRGHLLAVWQPVLLESNVYKSKQSRETKGQSYAVNYCKKM
jgi:hypothetical protein